MVFAWRNCIHTSTSSEASCRIPGIFRALVSRRKRWFMRSASLQSPPVTSMASRRPDPSGLAASLTLAAMSLGYGVVQLDVTIVNTALHAIGTSLGGGVGGGRESRADRGAVRRRRVDHADRLARDLPGQSADRARRAVADLALCRGNAAPGPARARPARPDRGGRSAWLPGRRVDRSRPEGLGASAGIDRFRR